MKTKLSVLFFCLCSLISFSACNSGNKQKQSTQLETLPTPVRDFLSQKYPAATILKIEKEQNGTEVDIQEKNIHKEIRFDIGNQWVSTHWNIKSDDVPVAIMEALASSAYNQYTIEDITLIERPSGTFYRFELKQENNEVDLVFDSKAQVAVQ